ncbi:unnamed protein product [Parnassius mnemosyne]|uniref:Peptidoglycan recognition protein family domain-containing protein n=2 Tax=Parnassius mnemosyne TaxID=213953 RepID=A0AAV1LXW0_9NEOP
MIRAKYYCILFVLILQWCNSSATCPQIVTRKDWDGLRPVHVSYLPRPVALVIIQHTVTSTCNTDEKCAEIVRNIQSYHMENLNYWDIGPSFLIKSNRSIGTN